ncbi:MAG TPA: hypothetical protein EYH31_09160 [Anaerolineae bacterium]|nr:hypothetical protein [Anaerolineae bacterium]
MAGKFQGPTVTRRQLITLAIVVLVLVFLANYASQLVTSSAVRAEELYWRQEKEKALARQRELEAYLEYVRSPEYIESVLRGGFGWVKDGEKLIQIVPVETAGSAHTALPSSPERRVESEPSNWERWWEKFFGRS